jgi:hypothetical protein
VEPEDDDKKCPFSMQGYAERYFLKELSAAEHDAYVEHFFCCNVCAEEVDAFDDLKSVSNVVATEDRCDVVTENRRCRLPRRGKIRRRRSRRE